MHQANLTIRFSDSRESLCGYVYYMEAVDILDAVVDQVRKKGNLTNVNSKLCKLYS